MVRATRCGRASGRRCEPDSYQTCFSFSGRFCWRRAEHNLDLLVVTHGGRNFKYILKVAHAPSRGRNFEMGRAGPAAPVLPEWIWLSVESPELSQRGAIAHINNLLAVSGVPPIKRSYYQRHAARRKAQRLGLGSEEPAVKRPSTDDPAKAARAEPAHAADYSPSDEPHSPSEGFVEGSSCVEEEPSASAVATAAARSCVSNGTYTHILTMYATIYLHTYTASVRLPLALRPHSFSSSLR